MVKSRGYTLIELMIVLALVGIAMTSLFASFGPYQDRATFALHRESVAHVLDVEMERMRACDSRACLRAIASSTIASDASDTWVRAHVRRTVSAGPDGTMRLRVEASTDDRGSTQTLDSLMWVPR